MRSSNSPFTIRNEIQFWGRQIAEHQLFIYSGMVNNNIIRDTNTRHLERGVLNLRDEAMENHRIWQELSHSSNPAGKLDEVMDEIKRILDYQEYISETLKKGIFLGWNYPSLIGHMTMETKYFLKKLRGEGYVFESEVRFWLEHHKGETAVAEKQLDPIETGLSKIIRDYDEELEKLQTDLVNTSRRLDEDEMSDVLQGYDRIGNSLNWGAENAQLASITPIPVIKHAIREGQRAKQIFEWLRDNQRQ